MGRTASLPTAGHWSTYPDQLRRFEALALLTQRTAFIKTLMGIDDTDVKVRSMVKLICERHGVTWKRLPGGGFDVLHPKFLSLPERYAASVLLSDVLRNCGGDLRIEENQVSGAMLDRLLHTFHSFLTAYNVTGETTPLSFEKFYFLACRYFTGDVDLMACNNCASHFINLKVSHFQCPICMLHNHAVIPATSKRTGFGPQYSENETYSASPASAPARAVAHG